jgi:glycosyltransferase involved in cell wall biosynthesis
MRVAYVCTDPGVPAFGTKGASVHLQEVVRALREKGCSLELFVRRAGGPPPPDLADVPVQLLAPSSGAGPDREKAALSANEELARALGARGRFDLVYERYALFGHGAMEHAAALGVPGLLEVNAPLIEEQAEHRGLVDREGAERASAAAFRAASAILAVSREVADRLERSPSAGGKVHVVPNGVDPRRFARSGAARIGRSADFTVGFVGTLKPWHGLPILVDAFVRLHDGHPGARLLVVGEGPERPSLERSLEARGISRAARLTGAVPPGDVPRLLAEMDTGVAPYPAGDFYFSPLKVYEYMAAGLPVVASRIGQLAALLEDGVTGLLCPPGDAAAFAQALERLMYDPALAARLGLAARERVLREHTWERVAARILAIAAQSAVEAAR